MSDIIIKKDDFTPWLEKYVGTVAWRVNQKVRKYAKKIEAEAARDAPYDTGALQNSIIAEPVDERNWEIHDGVEYGIYQELGTSRGVPARHFLGGAAERNSKAFFREVREELEKE